MTAYLEKETKRWRWRFTYKGKRASGSAPPGSNTKKTALALEKLELEKLVGRRWDGEMLTVAKFAPQFLEYQKEHTKGLTYRTQSSIVTTHIVTHLGTLDLDEVSAHAIDLLKTKWTCEATTKNLRLRVLTRMLSLAKEWGMIDRVPKAKKLKVQKDVPRFLEEDEAAALIVHAFDNWRSMIVVGLRTGLRIGELRGLQWGDISFVRGTIHVRRTDPGIAKYEATSPKSNKPRVVPLSPGALTALVVERAGSTTTGSRDLVWPGVAWPKRMKRLGGLRARSEANCYEQIQAIAALSGIKHPKEVAWHTLRHTYASWLVKRGVSLRVVQELLGHSSVVQTEIYAHLSPGVAHHASVALLDVPFVELQAANQTSAKPLLSSGTLPNDSDRVQGEQ